LDERRKAKCWEAQTSNFRCLGCALIAVLLSLPFAMAGGKQSVSAPPPQAIAKGFQTTDAAALVALCKYMQDPANGVWVGTIENVGRYIQQQRAGRGE
jgi:hypothetical protein